MVYDENRGRILGERRVFVGDPYDCLSGDCIVPNAEIGVCGIAGTEEA